MKARITLDDAGRSALPKRLREALRVGPGDTLEIQSGGERLVISPVRLRPGLQREQGIWVYRSGNPANISIPALIDRQRDNRSHRILAGGR
jgi:AbrB family looped-hinge helix DNA binding protein